MLSNATQNWRWPLVMLACILASGCATWTGASRTLLPEDTASPVRPSENSRPVVRGPVDPAPQARGGQSTAPATTRPAAQSPAAQSPAAGKPVVRGQSPDEEDYYPRQPVPASGMESFTSDDPSQGDPRAAVQPAQYTQGTWTSTSPNRPPSTSYSAPYAATPYGTPPGPAAPPAYTGAAPPPGAVPLNSAPPAYPVPGAPPAAYGEPLPPPSSYLGPPTDIPGSLQIDDNRYADLVVNVREQQTGRFMFGVGVNSDAGLTAQVVLDEYNFDWKRFPRRPDEIINGTAWRGAGQRLRIEAIPGTQLQRYLINFTEPYLFDTNVSLNLSGFLFTRNYTDWDEERLGGRIGLGYRLTPDLSLSAGLRMENVEITDPRVRGVEELDEVLGNNDLYAGRLTLTHDTRDSPFAATEGHFLEMSFEQAFGDFVYPRGQVDYRRYFLLNERPDGSGRHTLAASWQAGITGSDTPVFENFFAGGYSTMRGFRFRGASPKVDDVTVGGELSLLGSLEYLFPITADDMLKGVVFCDYGTVEEEVKIEGDDFRVALGAGLRIAIPAMGPAPIALDFAVPVAREETDRIQNFSFFVGFGR